MREGGEVKREQEREIKSQNLRTEPLLHNNYNNRQKEEGLSSYSVPRTSHGSTE